ncbi:hypothetical protein J2Z28_000442 [Paenibacillus xylanexedens]|uniref:Uncharacterized protein n=1 Tax=Paenibacillus xylanexedens TaxID=528191 RepID=A0ABS4RLS0_PAEXY|nr:hypothetical protein [Paenibacillus xylanexedens]
MDKEKVSAYMHEHFDDTNSDKDRLIKDFMVLMEFGQFDAEEEEETEDNEAYDNW